MGDYLYYTFENSRLCTRGLHRHGFPLLLWDALVQTGYGDRAQSTTVGSMRSMVYNAVRSTLISRPTMCFLTGAHGPRGLLGPTWTMLWRRLLTWHPLPCARRTWPRLQARPTCCILSRTAPTQCGRLAWMRWAMSFRFTTIVDGRTWQDMPSTCFSYSMTCSTSLWSSGATLLVMPRKSRTSPRRSVTRPKRMVLSSVG
jgi:hypothetical protein